MRFLSLIAAATAASSTTSASAIPPQYGSSLRISIDVADGLLTNSTDGHVLLMLAPAGVDPLNDTDVITSPNYFYGNNVFGFGPIDNITLSGGSGAQPRTGVWGFPEVNLDQVPAGAYRIQAFLNKYDMVTREDGSQVSVRFPCGDGALPVNGPGSLTTTARDIRVANVPQQIDLTFNNVTAVEDFNGTEVGGCSQGNYLDTPYLKYVKIRSKVLSQFWNRDMYVGANILLPHGYNASDRSTRYPVIYHQNHWAAGSGVYGYLEDKSFTSGWESGVIPGTNGTKVPKMILVQFRHETPFYDDSYAVNTANIGPYGDAINDELIPHIEKLFHTIPEPYARIQDGGSTGGWESAANVIFRPDLFGACFSSYPDSLDFHRHQAIPLYSAENAYVRPDGSPIYSIREVINGTLTDVTTVAQENHWELTYGTSSRSALQWDVWNAVFGVQGLNGYPLEPWDKVTGEIYPEAVEYWKSMDLANHIVSNWDNEKNLGRALRRRIFIYVGSWDNYFLQLGVDQFQKTVSAKGGPNWANITIIQGNEHGGNYQDRDIWDYLQLVHEWIQDHSPDGPEPLSDEDTAPTTRGNLWKEVIAQGGHQAAIARQAPPIMTKERRRARASVGRWDPGVTLKAEWVVNGKSTGRPFEVEQGDEVTYHHKSPWSPWGKHQSCHLQLLVTGKKRGYDDEKRRSTAIEMGR